MKVLRVRSSGYSARRDSRCIHILPPRLTSLRHRSRRRTACCSMFNSAGCRASIYSDGFANSVSGRRSFLSLRMMGRGFVSRLSEVVARRTFLNPCSAKYFSMPTPKPSTPMPKTNQNKPKGNAHAGQNEESATRVVREVTAWLLAPNGLLHGLNLPSVNSLRRGKSNPEHAMVRSNP